MRTGLKLILLFSGLTFGLNGQPDQYPTDYFVPPLDIPLYLSGTFGELRTNHFHSGIDIKTNGREGEPVKAAASGVVYRIKVSPYGFGNALYIRHPNGYSTVYAHLKEFNEAITSYVRKEQYRQQSFGIELYPPAGMFRVEQGDVIALSGNTGGSGGPHLHFEVRDSRTEKIINPLLFGFDVKDSRTPDLYELFVYDFTGEELSAVRNFRLVQIAPGEYRLTGSDVVTVTGSPAFGLQTFDRLDGVPNKNGVYKIGMWIAGEPYYDFTMETFAFDETRYINSHIDFGQKACCRKSINRLYLEPNNQLSVYGIREKMKLFKGEADSTYQVRIEVSDVAGNTATLLFDVRSEAGEERNTSKPGGLSVFKYNQTNFFKNDQVSMVLPEGALYRDVYFEYEQKEKCASCVSAVHRIGAREIPVQRYYNLKIRPDRNYKGKKDKLAIASIRNGEIVDYEGGRWEDGFIVGRTRQFGEFAVVTDSIAPRITALNFKSGKKISGQNPLMIKVTDNFSGIDSYRASLDGQWVLMAYDAKNKLMTIAPEELKSSPGEHQLMITVSDAMHNKSEVRYTLLF